MRGPGSGSLNDAPCFKDSSMTLILNFLRTLFAEPLQTYRSMRDAGQPTNDFDLMLHAMSRLRDTEPAEREATVYAEPAPEAGQQTPRG